MRDKTATSRQTFRRLLLERRTHSLVFLVLLLALLSSAGYVILERGGLGKPELVQEEVPPVDLAEAGPPELKEISGIFRRNQTITEALLQHGLTSQQVHQLVESARPVYNLSKVGASRPYWLDLTSEGEFHEFRYPVDDERYLTISKDGDQYVPVLREFPYETFVEPVSGVIEDSLFMTVKRIGEQEQLALDLAGIFMWDIDFHTDIQRGDSFRLLVEKKYLEGKFTRYGAILTASITNQNRTLTGYRFREGDGAWGYYNDEGKSLKKSFLKSPLKFGRVTSGFSHARMHPIHRTVRPHLGVDYAAPTGTPVVAVGSGVVRFAGTKGGSGRMVRIRHARSYETMYLHLSKITVRSGAAVSQGQVIGRVGSTGVATGPHLDFRVMHHGKFVNPMKVVFPPEPPVSPEAFPAFAAVRDSLKARIDERFADQE